MIVIRRKINGSSHYVGFAVEAIFCTFLLVWWPHTVFFGCRHGTSVSMEGKREVLLDGFSWPPGSDERADHA
jgi:hypothetical protein